MEKIRNRIELKVPRMPYSLRKFIENIVEDDSAYKSMVESPISAMIAAGIPISSNEFTRRDYVRIIKVMTNLRNEVKKLKPTEKLKFEQIFDVSVGDKVAYWNETEHTNACTDQNWDKSAPDKEMTEGTKECADDTFTAWGDGTEIIQHEEIMTNVPLMSASELTEILVRIDEKIITIRK